MLKMSLLSKASWFCTLTVFVFAIGGAHPAKADAVKMPVQVEVSLPEATITLGEPLVLHYVLSNRLQDPVQEKAWVHFGTVFEPRWYRLVVVDAKGKEVPAVPDRTPLASTTGKRNVQRTGQWLEPGKPPYRGQIVVSRYAAIAEAGNYWVKVQVRLPYAIGPEESNGKRLSDGSGVTQQLFEQDYEFPVTVLPRDSVRLTRTAQSLRTAARRDNYYENAYAVEALFSMPERAAQPYWRELILSPPNGSLVRLEIRRQYLRLGTPAIARVLAEYALSPDTPAGIRDTLIQTLQQIKTNGNPETEETINRLLPTQ